MAKQYYESFCGNKVSLYGLQNGYLDYATLSKCFDSVLCNNIAQSHFDEMELVNGMDYAYFDEDGNEVTENDDYYSQDPVDIFQYYIISDNGYHIMAEEFKTNEIIYYIESLDIYVWGVTHYGTSWAYTLTEIPLREKEC